MKEFKADMHIHTCLSPCADITMSPRSIVDTARKKGLDIIAICDHNSAENVPAALRCGERIGVKVIGGMEITTAEEVHVLALFDSLKSLFEVQNIVYKGLGEDEKIAEEQVIADENDIVIGFNKKLLISATNTSINEIVDTIHTLNGLAIASHIDRESFSVTGQLGFIPEGLRFDALEVINVDNVKNYSFRDVVYITSSDAHFLWDIGQRYTTFLMENASFEEIKQCMQSKMTRRIII
jgi:predicted metal-dependent phosphoesterase TrpH